MHRILEQVCAIAERERAEWLPEVTPQQLEQDGAVFYMNSQNGTEFDWYVNDRLPSFMVFYNDKANLGAVKLHLNRNGTVSVYLYGEQGARLQKQETLPAEYAEEELLGLAVQLRQAADDQRRWDADIRLLAADGAVPEAEAIQQFQSHGESYAAMRQRRMLLAQNAIVSRKILDEGWKVGYMERTETDRDGDSGWFFASGTEEPGYLADYHHLALVPVGIVWQQFDPDIFRYLDSPAGTRLMRVSEDRFEPDQPDREIYAVRR